jgi:hypothetical protein
MPDWLKAVGDDAAWAYDDALRAEADRADDEDGRDYDALDPERGLPAELAELSAQELYELNPLAYDDPGSDLGDGHRRPPAPWPLCYGDSGDLSALLPHDRTGTGPGFAGGGPLDTLPAGLGLAGHTDQAYAELGTLDDDSLIGVLQAWRRLTSWAQARELALVGALARRRPADGHPPAGPAEVPMHVSPYLDAEVAAALTLTPTSGRATTELSLAFIRRPATWAVLEQGWLDLPRARLIVEMTAVLDDEHASAVEAAVLPGAPDMTTGQLRRALRKAILDVDPEAMRRRREQAEQQARVDAWADPDGTASLAGYNLPPAPALAADRRLTQIATAWKRQGAQGGMDLLRAHAYLALLNGLDTSRPPASLLPGQLRPPTPPGSATPPDPAASASATPASAGEPLPGAQQVPPGLHHPPPADELPPLAGQIHLTVPLTTLLGHGEAPGAAAGYGPVDADTARLLACAAAGHPATRWHITVTSPAGYALATGTTRGNPARRDSTRGNPAGARSVRNGAGQQAPATGPEDTAAPRMGSTGGSGWTVQVTAEPITTGNCDHHNAEPGYRPSPALQRLIRARTTTCTAPGCGRPATRCDLDHTIPHDNGGRTCECNLAPLCRYHHQVKQAENWTLEQPSPGVMAWLTPAGRRYVTLPSQHPT